MLVSTSFCNDEMRQEFHRQIKLSCSIALLLFSMNLAKWVQSFEYSGTPLYNTLTLYPAPPQKNGEIGWKILSRALKHSVCGFDKVPVRY